VQENFNFFLSGNVRRCHELQSARQTLSFVRIPDKTRQNISTLISKTRGTGLTALRLKLKQRYWLIA
jgi:hypothetical protein